MRSATFQCQNRECHESFEATWEGCERVHCPLCGWSPRQAVVYARISPKPKRKKQTNGKPVKVARPKGIEDSIEPQIDYCVRYCSLYGFQIVAVHFDRRQSGKSAGRKSRPEFLKAIHLAKQQKAVLVGYAMSRFFRNTELACKLLRVLNKAGAALAAVAERVDTTTASGRCWFRIKAAIDEMEREQTGERTRDVMRGYQSAGMKMSSRAPFGFRIDAENDSMLLPDISEQETLSRMLALRATGMGLRAIGRELERENRLCRGKRWHHKVLNDILARAARG